MNNQDDGTFYCIDRSKKPSEKKRESKGWRKFDNSRETQANTVCTFVIEADPSEIENKWKAYYEKNPTHLLSNNCAAAVQWFLTTFTSIPHPQLTNSLRLNYLSLGFFWPSAVPCPVTLPGLIISNVEFHLEIKKRLTAIMKNSDSLTQSCQQLQQCIKRSRFAMIVTASIGATSIFGLLVATNILTCGIAIAGTTSIFGLLIATSVLTSGIATAAIFISMYAFSKAYNTWSIHSELLQQLSTEFTDNSSILLADTRESKLINFSPNM
ncbi:MAG: hypothetical protein GKR77_00325 [Legionellales bacterium]|nr:hypothetical protein [Legionellales bacterium]